MIKLPSEKGVEATSPPQTFTAAAHPRRSVLAAAFEQSVSFPQISSHQTKAIGGGSVARRTATSSKALAMDNPPNANIHQIVKAQIVFLLSTLTEDNFDRNQIEIRSVSTV